MEAGSRSRLELLLDGIAEVSDHPKTTLAQMLEGVVARARAEQDDPRTIEMGEWMAGQAWEQAEAEHFQ